jgi:hypothetical protein
MATQFQLLSASQKVQFIRKATLADLVCIKDNGKSCSWRCLGFREPIVRGTNTVVIFRCGSYPIEIEVPTSDFVDAR